MTNLSLKQAVSLVLTCSTLALATSGCSRLAMNDGSLDYQKAKLLKPITIPENQRTREIFPLYPLPDKGEANQLPLTNKKGNRYELPRASVQKATVPVIETQHTGSSHETTVEQTPAVTAKPRVALTQTEEGIPILQVEASADKTAALLPSVLSRASYMVVSEQPGQIKIAHVKLQGARLLQYRNLGSVTTVVVTTENSKLAENKESALILADLRSNW